MLKLVWITTNHSAHTKIKVFRSYVLSVLLYGAECWKTTVAIQLKLVMFQTKFLRRILNIYWPSTISNEELKKTEIHTGRNYTKTSVVRMCLPHALQHQNRPQMDTSWLEKEGTTKRDMAAYRGERPQYHGTESRHGPEQQQTETDGEPMLSPHVPDGAEKMNL